MRCPVCDDTEMFVLEFELVELDYCPGCAGVWLDSGELELVGARAGALRSGLLAALEAGAGRRPAGRPLRCPVCRKRMREVQTETSPPVVVDRCARGHGLWFDSGELDAAVRAAGAEEDNVLARFFAELGGTQGPDSR
jgi:Zn-finger nucleic acid-binding protein